MSERWIAGIDLFCGAGGLSFGLKEAGVDIRGGIDIDSACRYPYEKNIGSTFICESVRNVTASQLDEMWGLVPYRLLSGCAPCQPFSTQRRGADTSKEEAWDLLDQFGRLVRDTLPDFVTMENVVPLMKSELFERFLSVLGDNGYIVTYKILRAEQYGLPQARRRLVLVGSLHGQIDIPDPFVEPGHERTVRDTLQGLPRLEAGEHDGRDRLHRARALSDVNLARIKASKPGGSWMDWPEELRAACHRRSSGNSFKSFYGVMDPDQPSPTITTQFYNYGSGRFGHPFESRAITPREAAMLQGFPRDYAFVAPGSPMSFSSVGRMIGNAVPPIFGKVVGLALMRKIGELAAQAKGIMAI